MATATLMGTDMSAWAPVTQHWRTSDGQNLAVECSEGDIPEGAIPMVDEALVKLGESFSSTILTLRPTIIVACDPDGSPLDDTVPEPLYTFAPGTTHIQALEQAGYTIG